MLLLIVSSKTKNSLVRDFVSHNRSTLGVESSRAEPARGSARVGLRKVEPSLARLVTQTFPEKRLEARLGRLEARLERLVEPDTKKTILHPNKLRPPLPRATTSSSPQPRSIQTLWRIFARGSAATNARWHHHHPPPAALPPPAFRLSPALLNWWS
jgi:hypothetical protein